MLLAIPTIIGIAWFGLATLRDRELASLKELLPGTELLDESGLIDEPYLIRVDTMRTWTYRIGEDQQARLEALCESLENRFPNNRIDSRWGCVAAFYEDASKYRIVSLAVRPGIADLTANYLSGSEYAIATTGEYEDPDNPKPTP